MKSLIINKTTAIAISSIFALTPTMTFAEENTQLPVVSTQIEDTTLKSINHVPNKTLGKTIIHNGIPTDVRLHSINGVDYIGLSDYANLNGYITNYNKAKNTISITSPMQGSIIETKIGSDTIYYNGKANTISPKPVVVGEQVLMPFDELVKLSGDTYTEKADSVILYTKNPVQVEGVNIGTNTIKNEYTKDYNNGIKDTVKYTIQVPKISGMKDEKFQKTLNETFENYSKSAQKEAKEMFDEIMAHDSFDFNGEVYVNYEVNNYKNGILSVTIYKYVYANGANGQTYATTYNIDLNNSKILTYDDIFKVDNYSEILIDTMNKMIDADKVTYEGVEKVKKLDDNNFYLQDGNLVIYYMPYEISYGARGIVTFIIDTNTLSKFMEPEYVGLK